MNNVTMYTYQKTNLPPEGMPFQKDGYWYLKPELPFFWWLSPWKTCEDLQLSLLKSVEERRTEVNKLHDDWSKEYNSTSAALEELRDKVYHLKNELETVKAERDAANDAVRTLRKKSRRK